MFFLSGAEPLWWEETARVSRGDRVTDVWGPKMSPRRTVETSQLDTTCPKACDLQSNRSLKVIKSSEDLLPRGARNGSQSCGLWCLVLISSGVKVRVRRVSDLLVSWAMIVKSVQLIPGRAHLSQCSLSSQHYLPGQPDLIWAGRKAFKMRTLALCPHSDSERVWCIVYYTPIFSDIWSFVVECEVWTSSNLNIMHKFLQEINIKVQNCAPNGFTFFYKILFPSWIWPIHWFFTLESLKRWHEICGYYAGTALVKHALLCLILMNVKKIHKNWHYLLCLVHNDRGKTYCVN